MSTIDDLRDTLAAHAGQAEDRAAVVRTAEVRRRVQVVRRRRRAAVAGTAAAVVAVAGLGLAGGLLPRQDRLDPAQVRLAGQQVPREVSVLGFGYDYAEGVEAEVVDGVARVRLPAGSRDRAVSLAASGLDGGAATLTAYAPVGRLLDSGGVTSPVPVGAQRQTLRVRLHDAPADAAVGIAVYERDDTVPAGVGDRDAVFREEVGGDRLVGGGFGEPGQSSLTVPVEGDVSGGVRLVPFCDTDRRGLWVDLRVDGEPSGGFGCGDGPGEPDEDAGTASSYWQPRLSPGTGHEVEVRLRRGSSGPFVSDPGTTLGIGVYATEPRTTRVLGERVDPTVELDGRTWVLDRTTAPTDGPLDLAGLRTGAEDLVLGYVTVGAGWVDLSYRGRLAPGGSTSFQDRDARRIAGTLGVLLAGDSYHVEVGPHGDPPGFRAALLVYRPADG